MGHPIEFIVQVFLIISVAHAAVYSYKIAKWSCATSVQWLTAGFIYVLAWRVMFFLIHSFDIGPRVWVESHQSFFIVPSFTMWAWGLYLLYRTLSSLGK